MNPYDLIDAFDAQARADGFEQILDRDWGANEVLPEHTHPFDARALVVRGDMWLEHGGTSRHLQPGDRFELAALTPHTERYGPQGATYRVARRQPTT